MRTYDAGDAAASRVAQTVDDDAGRADAARPNGASRSCATRRSSARPARSSACRSRLELGRTTRIAAVLDRPRRPAALLDAADAGHARRAGRAPRPLRHGRRTSAARRSVPRPAGIRARLRLRIVRRDRMSASTRPDSAVRASTTICRQPAPRRQLRSARAARRPLQGRARVRPACRWTSSLFFDAGVAWSRDDARRRSPAAPARSSAASAAPPASTSFGLLIIEVAASRPLDRLAKGVSGRSD